jgi:hypothetical protein
MGVSVTVLLGSGADVDTSVDVKDDAIGTEVGVSVDDDPRAAMAKMLPTHKADPAIKLTRPTTIICQIEKVFLFTLGCSFMIHSL